MFVFLCASVWVCLCMQLVAEQKPGWFIVYVCACAYTCRSGWNLILYIEKDIAVLCSGDCQV